MPWNISQIRECLSGCFPGEWGATPKGDGNAKVLRATDIDDDGHIVSQGVARQVPTEKLSWKALIPGDVLLESSGGGPGKPVGRVALFEMAGDRAFICSNFFRTLRPDVSRVHPGFFCARLVYLHAMPKIWHFQQQTTGIINLKIQDYLNSEIDLPPYDEQREISDILTVVDSCIRRTDQIVEKLKSAKQGLLHDLLSRGIDDNGELRDPIRHSAQFARTELGLFPRDWGVHALASIATIRSGTTPSRHEKQFWTGGTVPWVKTSEIHFADIHDTEEKVTEFALQNTSLELLPPETVLVAMYGQGATRGRCGILRIAATTNQACAAILGNKQRVQQRFLYHLLCASYENLRGLGHGSQQTNLSSSLLSHIKIPVPPTEEQAAISAIVDQIDSRCLSEVDTVAKLRLLKQSLMDDLLTGRVRVTPLLAKDSTP